MHRKRPFEAYVSVSETHVLVSVVIPAFNAGRYIRQALESVAKQTEQRFEVIVVDDASQDDTAAVTSELVRTDARIRLIRLPVNGGPGAARNIAIDAAIGKWVALLDADDCYHPQRLERLLKLAERTGADMVSDNIILHQEDGTVPERVMYSTDRIPGEMQLTATEFIIQNTSTGNGTRSSFGFMQPIFRREFLQNAKMAYDRHNRFGEDFMFYVKCLMQGANWWIMPDPLYYYTIRQGSLTETVSPDDLRVISAMEQELLDQARSPANFGFNVAVRKHKRTVDHWRHTMAFKAALRRRCFREAFDIAFESRSSLQSILRDIAANTFLRMYRPVRDVVAHRGASAPG